MLNALTTKAYVKVTEAIRSFKESEHGVTAIEYGLIAVAVAAMIVVVFYNQGGLIDALITKFADLTSKVSSATVN